MTAPAVDERRATEFLNARFGHVEDVGPAGSGEWSVAYFYRMSGEDLVVRFGNHPEDFQKDRAAAGFASERLPIPAIREIGEVGDFHFAVSERAFGRLLDTLNGREMGRVVPSLLAALDGMREASLAGTEGFGMWAAGNRAAPYASWRDFLLSVGTDDPGGRIHGWREALAGSPVGDAPFDEAFAALGRLSLGLVPERSLIHSDLLYHNVLVQGRRISAVIDWGKSLYGDFLYDLACLSFWKPWYPAMGAIDWEAEARAHYSRIGLEVPDMERRLLCCKLYTGLQGQAYHAFSGRLNDLEVSARNTLALARTK
jgi:hygromycin-B 4-O-kinase